MIKCDRCGALGATKLSIDGAADNDSLPTLCYQCFRKEMKQARENNPKMTMGEFIESLRRRKVH
jgi:hypothetical protein